VSTLKGHRAKQIKDQRRVYAIVDDLLEAQGMSRPKSKSKPKTAKGAQELLDRVKRRIDEG
jgi:hypothetical protein